MQCSGRRFAVIPRFHFSKSRDIELRLRPSVDRIGDRGREAKRRVGVCKTSSRWIPEVVAAGRGSPGGKRDRHRRRTRFHTCCALQSDRDQSISHSALESRLVFSNSHISRHWRPWRRRRRWVELQRFAPHHRHFLITNRDPPADWGQKTSAETSAARGQLSFRKLRCFH